MGEQENEVLWPGVRNQFHVYTTSLKRARHSKTVLVRGEGRRITEIGRFYFLESTRKPFKNCFDRETRTLLLQLDSWFYDRASIGESKGTFAAPRSLQWKLDYSSFDRITRILLPRFTLNIISYDLHNARCEFAQITWITRYDTSQIRTNREKYLHLTRKWRKSRGLNLKKMECPLGRTNGGILRPAAYLKINSRASAWQAAVCNNVQQLEALYHWPFANRNGMKRYDDAQGSRTLVRMMHASADRWLSWDGMRTINCKTSSQSGRERERERARVPSERSIKKRRRNGRQWSGQTRLIWEEIGRPIIRLAYPWDRSKIDKSIFDLTHRARCCMLLHSIVVQILIVLFKKKEIYYRDETILFSSTHIDSIFPAKIYYRNAAYGDNRYRFSITREWNSHVNARD